MFRKPPVSQSPVAGKERGAQLPAGTGVGEKAAREFQQQGKGMEQDLPAGAS